MLAGLSYRYKIPLSFSAIALAVALAVSAVLIWRAYADAREDLVASAEQLGRSLARSLVPALLRDDVWGAYETVITPLSLPGGAHAAPTILVLDASTRIYVSSEPTRFPTATDLTVAAPALARLRHRLLGDGGYQVFEDADTEQLYVAAPIAAEGGRLGTVLLVYANEFFLPRFHATVEHVLLIIGGILVVLLPLGWYWGRRVASPLVRLAACMDLVGSRAPSAVECDLREGGDEIGHLAGRFKEMLRQLREKEALEAEIVRSDRLAAVGRITAGIAHEINNPLGGMLNAISTFRRHGPDNPFTARTLSLLERGLVQIKEIVGALLVEAKVETHALTPRDIDDARTLAATDINRKSATLDWRNELSRPVALPSTPVRQVLINLLLNASQAVDEHGRVRCRVWQEGDSLRLEVENDGRYLTSAQMERLFEPFAGDSRGAGLGLWLTYQIVQQLKGHIQAESRPGTTRFQITLPFEVTHDDNMRAHQALSH